MEEKKNFTLENLSKRNDILIEKMNSLTYEKDRATRTPISKAEADTFVCDGAKLTFLTW